MSTRDDAIAAVDAYAAAAAATATAAQVAADQASAANLQNQLALVQAALTAEQAQDVVDAATEKALQDRIAALEAQLNPSPPARYPGDPGMKVVGTSYGTLNSTDTGDGTPGPVEAFFGETLRLFRFYREEDDTAASIAAAAARDAAAGRMLVVSQKIPGNDWAKVVNGSQDGFLKDRFDALASGGGNAQLIVHHEPENDGLVTADYRDGQVRIAETLKSYPSIGFWPAAMGGHYNPNTTGDKSTFTDYYPDVSIYAGFGFDQYEQSYVGSEHHHTVAQLIQADIDYFHAHGVPADMPIALWETGVRPDPAIPGYSAAWLQDLDQIDLAMLSYYFSNRNAPHGSWAWTSTTDERYPVLKGMLHRSAVARVKV